MSSAGSPTAARSQSTMPVRRPPLRNTFAGHRSPWRTDSTPEWPGSNSRSQPRAPVAAWPPKPREPVLHEPEMAFGGKLVSSEPPGLGLVEHRARRARVEVPGDPGQRGRPADRQSGQILREEIPADAFETWTSGALLHHGEHATERIDPVVTEEDTRCRPLDPSQSVLHGRLEEPAAAPHRGEASAGRGDGPLGRSAVQPEAQHVRDTPCGNRRGGTR